MLLKWGCRMERNGTIIESHENYHIMVEIQGDDSQCHTRKQGISRTLMTTDTVSLGKTTTAPYVGYFRFEVTFPKVPGPTPLPDLPNKLLVLEKELFFIVNASSP